MEMKRHCDLCQHQFLSIEKGSVCNLTKDKPNFRNLCKKIVLTYRSKKKLKEILIDYADLKQNKTKIYIQSFFDILFGSLIVLCGYLLWSYFLDQDYNYSLYYVKLVLILPFIILSVGFILINKGINIAISHRKNLKHIKKSKNSIDEVLNLYNKKYTYSVKFEEEVHGIQEVEIQINFLK